MSPKKDSAVLILAPFLYLGPRSATSQHFLTSHGITNVLSIGASPCSRPTEVKFEQITLADNPDSTIETAVDLAIPIIDGAKKGKILVHCSAAISRSPSVVAAYLMKAHGISLKDALGKIVNARPSVCPNPGSFEQLKEMENQLFGRCSLEGVEVLPLKRSERLALFAS